MDEQGVIRWGGLVCMLTAALFGLGGVLAAIVPDGGLSSPLVPLSYYLGTITAVPALLALYAAQHPSIGRLGLAGFVFAILGAILYSGPQFALVAGTAGAAGWHDVWGFAMRNVLLIGPAAFFVGMILFGVASGRAGTWPTWSGRLLSVGASIWLVAYFLSVVPGLLTAASLVTAAGLGWMGWMLWSGGFQTAAQSRLAA